MLQLRHLVVVAVLAVASFAISVPAFAQGTKLVVVDQHRVLTESAAGQDIATKIQTIQDQMQRELNALKGREAAGSSVAQRRPQRRWGRRCEGCGVGCGVKGAA